MQAKPAAAGLPLRAMWMIEQATIQRPAFSTVTRFEKRGRLDSTIQRVFVMRIVNDLPNLLERNLRAFRTLVVVSLGIAPRFSKVAR